MSGRPILAELVDWRLETRGATLVARPSIDVYLRQLVALIIPCVILGGLWLSGLTPWRLHAPSSGREGSEDRPQAADPQLLKQTQAAKAEMLETFGQILGEDAARRIGEEAHETTARNRLERQRNMERQQAKLRPMMLAMGLMVTVVWTFFGGYALLLVAALPRLACASYRFWRDRDGLLRMEIPRMFRTLGVAVPAADVRGLRIGTVAGQAGYRYRQPFEMVCVELVRGGGDHRLPVFVAGLIGKGRSESHAWQAAGEFCDRLAQVFQLPVAGSGGKSRPRA